MFYGRAKYCSECGSDLKPVSWKAWEEKVVYPALEKDVFGAASDISQLLQSASKMGFMPEEAEAHFNNLFQQETNVSRDDFHTWVLESVLPLKDCEHDSAASAQKVWDEARRLRISYAYAERVLRRLVQSTNSPKSLKSSEASQAPDVSKQPTDPTTSIDHDQQPEMVRTEKAANGRESAKSFYRRLVSGGSVTKTLTHLDFKKSASKKGLRNTDDSLKEVSSDGAFVVFASDESHGWVFPNPKLTFDADSLKPLFATLTADQFNNFKEHIEPVRVIRIGKRLWKVEATENIAHDSRGHSGTSIESSDREPTKAVLVFPVSAAECLEKNQSSARIVRRDVAMNLLVNGPGGKGEFSLISNASLSEKGDQLFVIPRITSFKSENTFHSLYKEYYECAKPSSGEVWIIKPALVSTVEGGWALSAKGELEIDFLPRRQVSKVEREVVEIDKAVLPIPRPRADGRLRLVIGIAVSLALLAALLIGISKNSEQPVENRNPRPTPTPPPNMVRVDGGEFQMGDDAGDEYEKPAHNVFVKPFFMDIYEVTCEEYLNFNKATGHRVPPNWVRGRYPHGMERKPVTGVDWYDASAYAAWAKKRLPTEEEWEFAARGITRQRYAWGNEWTATAANIGSVNKGLVDVGSYPQGKTPAGIMDLIGNAWEWTSSDLRPYPNAQLPTPPRDKDKVIRGGSWKEDSTQATTTYRGFLLASGEKDYSATGFRCVQDIGP